MRKGSSIFVAGLVVVLGIFVLGGGCQCREERQTVQPEEVEGITTVDLEPEEKVVEYKVEPGEEVVEEKVEPEEKVVEDKVEPEPFRVAATEVYLTFDDGPMAGTDDVINVLRAKKVTGSFFFVGGHAISIWRRDQVRAAFKAGFLIGSHGRFLKTDVYSNPKNVLKHFRENDPILAKILSLGPKTRFLHARLPGAACWRVGNIRADAKVRGVSTKAAADLLQKYGYKVYGWDLVWRHSGGPNASKPIETPEQMVQQVKDVIDKKIACRKQGKIVIVMHDHMFRTSRGNKRKLAAFIEGLKDLKGKYKVKFMDVSEY